MQFIYIVHFMVSNCCAERKFDLGIDIRRSHWLGWWKGEVVETSARKDYTIWALSSILVLVFATYLKTQHTVINVIRAEDTLFLFVPSLLTAQLHRIQRGMWKSIYCCTFVIVEAPSEWIFFWFFLFLVFLFESGNRWTFKHRLH